MTFTFNDQTFAYLRHRYNQANRNMRTVEVPIALDYIARCAGSVLEVGNVLSHYTAAAWPIIDLHEKARGVRNVDIMRCGGKYDLIVSISTVEHIGFDKYTFILKHTLEAVTDHMRGMLAAGGTLLITLPLGYRLDIDALLRARATGAADWYMCQDDAETNTWLQCDLETALHKKRGHWSRAVAILEYGGMA